jgi:hypothetical protein
MSSHLVYLEPSRRLLIAASTDDSHAADPPNGSDPSKAKPNQGEPHGPPYKTWYARERIQLDAASAERFTDDRQELCVELRERNRVFHKRSLFFHTRPKDLPGFHIRGKCPSCDHETSAVCATRFLAHDDENAGATADGKMTQVTLVRCACTYNHVPTTPGDFGCGSEWLLRVRFDEDSDAPVRFEPVSPEKATHRWPLAEAAAVDASACLTTAQATAKNWAPALGTLLTLFGIGALLTKGSGLLTLTSPWGILLLVAAGFAVVFNILMLVQSDLAQFGWLGRHKAPPDRRGLENEDLEPLFQAASSARKLRRAVWLSGLAILAAGGAIAILSFAPSLSTSKITYTDKHGIAVTTPCSTIATRPPNIVFKPTVSGSTPGTVKIKDVKSIAAC